MLSITSHSIETTIPAKKEALLAEKSSRILKSYFRSASTPIFEIIAKGKKKKEQLVLPSSAFKLLIDILGEIAKGNAVSVTPLHTELTTQEAADLLNVSRPFLVTLLEERKLPYRKVGTKRRVLAKDVLDYKNKIDQARLDTLQELSKQAQKLNMGY